jgi:enoyl-CoA hydratase
MSDLVTHTEHDNYCLVRMDDGKANALSFDMLSRISGALDDAAATGKVVVLAGRPGKFSAGFDLSVMGQGGEQMIRLLKEGAALSRRLLQFDAPVVLAVSGHALAMGALMLLSADYRIGIRGQYKIGLNEVAIGLPMPYVGAELAMARLSKRHLHNAVALAQTYDAEGAVDAGYLDEAVDEDQLADRAAAVAGQLAGLDMEAHRITKARIREGLLVALDQAIANELGA